MRRLTSAALLVLAIGCSPPAPPPPPPVGPAEDQITAESLVNHLKILASDEFEGRAPATPGGEKTTDYLAKQLSALGVEPGAPDGTYLQQVPIVESVVERNFVLSVPGNTYRYFTDVVAFSGVEKPRVQVQGDVVFVGYGINAPELKWNDYDGANVRGKWVMIMVNDPPAPADEPTLFAGNALTYYGRWTYKFEEAARQGAAGALLIHTDQSATYPWQVVQSSWSGTQYSLPPQAGEPALGIKGWITDAAAKDLAKRGGRDLDTMRAAASKRGFKAIAVNTRAAATLMQRSARKTAANVIGVIKGTNPAQGIIYSAHWDHFGIRDAQPGDAKDADRIFNGAYDNASGTARRARDRESLREGAAEAGALDLLCLRHRGGVGLAWFRVPGRQSAAADRSRSSPTSTSTASTISGRPPTWCSSARSARRSARWSKRSSRSATAP